MKCDTCGREAFADHRCTPPPSKYSIRSRRDHSAGWKVVVLSLVAGGVVAAIFVSIGLLKAKNRLERRLGFQETVTVEPGQSLAYLCPVSRAGFYNFEISGSDGALVMAMERLDDSDSEEVDSDAWDAVFKQGASIEAGREHRMHGALKPGRYLWGVLNPDSKKAVRVRIHFRTARGPNF